MTTNAHEISLRLLLWALVWLGASVVGLWASRPAMWRAFWFVSGAWAFVDALLAYVGVANDAPWDDMHRRALHETLSANAGFDVIYLIAAVWLATRPSSLQRGAGYAIAVQGAFLLAFDLGYSLVTR